MICPVPSHRFCAICRFPNPSDQGCADFCGGKTVPNHRILGLSGELSSIWSGHSEQALTREIIRNCHELGINILNYATRRYQMHNAMLVNPQYQKLDPKLADDQRRITNMVEKTA